MTVCLLISQEARPLSRLASALASSVLLHGAMVAAVWSYTGVWPNGAGPAPSPYRIQIVHLVENQEAVAVWPNASIQWQPAAEGRVPDHANQKPARETLRVGGAPPEAQLEQAVPLPAAAAWTGLNIVSSAAEQVGIRELNEALDAADPAFLRIPQIDIISVPDIALQDAAVPVVNQDAESSGPDGVIASQSPETPASSSVTGAATPDPTLTRIELPRHSRPPVSLLGLSVAGQYGEVANQMQAQVVSTIYLDMGLKKRWALEYWTAQPDQRGGITRLDAPWPYVMLRPKVEFSAGENVVLIRGVLTTEGQLQGLSPLLPPHRSQEDRLFEALAQWKFRPASRNGQPLPVEVLLVIPRQPEE